MIFWPDLNKKKSFFFYDRSDAPLLSSSINEDCSGGGAERWARSPISWSSPVCASYCLFQHVLHPKANRHTELRNSMTSANIWSENLCYTSLKQNLHVVCSHQTELNHLIYSPEKYFENQKMSFAFQWCCQDWSKVDTMLLKQIYRCGPSVLPMRFLHRHSIAHQTTAAWSKQQLEWCRSKKRPDTLFCIVGFEYKTWVRLKIEQESQNTLQKTHDSSLDYKDMQNPSPWVSQVPPLKSQ